MYISENYLAFYSYLLGFELKVLIELKEIKDIYKEPIRKLFRHSMRVTTKDNQEVSGHIQREEYHLMYFLLYVFSTCFQTCSSVTRYVYKENSLLLFWIVLFVDTDLIGVRSSRAIDR